MTELRRRSSEGGEGGPLWSKGALVAVSLNIGGRKTNPFEFLLDGDSSKVGASATKARLRAQEGMVDAECGPARIASTERGIVDDIMSSLGCN